MRLHLFILLLFTSLCFGVDFNAKTEENKQTIMEFCVNYVTAYSAFEKYKDSLWFEDKTFLKELISKVHGHNLDELLKKIKNKKILNDKEFFTKVVKRDSRYFRFAGDALKSDRKYVLKLIQAGYYIYGNIDNKLHADKEITLLSVKQSGNYLRFADKKLKNDKEVVLEAVQKDGDALGYASKKLKDDNEVVWKAIQNNGRAFRHVSSRLESDKKLVLEALKTSIDSLWYVNKEMLKNRDVILYFFKMLDKENASRYHKFIMKIDPSLFDDEEIMLEAVGKNGMFLQYTSKRLRKNKTIVLKAVSENGLAFKYADKTLRENQEIVRSNPKVKYYIDNAKNKIKRKVKPLAWESYVIEDALELLYGKDRVYETSDDIDIKVPSNTFDNFTRIPLHIITNKKVKSIAILQDKELDRALTTLYYPYNNPVNIKLYIKKDSYPLMTYKSGIKITVITETEDNHLFINKYNVADEDYCRNGYSNNEYLENLKFEINKNYLKVKYKINEDGAGYFKFMIIHPMLSYREAAKLNVQANFVSHIKGSIKGKKFFDLYTSEYTEHNLFIRMEVSNMKQDEDIDFSYTTIDGKVTSKYVKPRKMKKKSH